MAIQRSTEPEKFRKFEQTGWDDAINGYEQAFGPLTAQTVEPLLDAAGVATRTSVLDVCTGHGVIAAAAVSRGAIVSGVDFAEQVVATARRNVPEAEFRQADAQALPYASGTFDSVICSYGIIHMPEPDRALLELVRVTRSGGGVAVSVWQPPLSTNGFGLLFGAINAHGRLDIQNPA
jgi:ubiquinone/menaquinone biosynthesis C-methylase UbiE